MTVAEPSAPATTGGMALHERLRYDYAAPVRDLRHRLIVVPPELHGDQRRVHHRVTVAGAEARMSTRVDGFGNQVVDVRADSVEAFVQFEIHVVVQRGERRQPALVPLAGARRFSAPSQLTQVDPTIAEMARSLRLARQRSADLASAERACSWAHSALRYEHDITTVRTTAAEALAAGRRVCQDFAHLMVALCRAEGMAARYVSGHLAGEGGSHAWVEVMAADPGYAGEATVVAFDPTHDRRAGHRYLTVAVGRDYRDVAPTSGTFQGSSPSVLSATKSLDVLEAEPGRALVLS